MAFILPAFAAIGSAIGGAAGTIGTIATVGSSLIGAYGAYSQGQATAKAAKFNAATKEIQATQVTDNASAVASNDALKTRQRVAAARAGSIQNGFEEEGSVSDILRTVETDGALEGLTALHEGSTRAASLRTGAALDQMTASNAKTSGYIGAGTQLLSGVSRLYTGGRDRLS